MTAAHLVLVWEERDDPNLLWHAQRAMEVGRNPRIVPYERGFGPSASYYAWEAAGRPVHAVRGKIGSAAALTLGVEEELMLVDPETFALAPGVERLLGPAGLKTELFSCLVETNTPVCETASRRATSSCGCAASSARRAAREGLAVAASRDASVLAAGGAGDRRTSRAT